MHIGAQGFTMEHMTWTPRRCGAQAALLLTVLLGAGCDSHHLDKAGGSAPDEPLVLRLAAHDDDYAYGIFAAAVARLSGGSMRISVAPDWRVTGDRREIGYEAGIVSDVRRGRVALGIVGVRVWDLLGVDSFQALVAPFLVDTLALERRALASPLATRALASLERKGVIGIALLPGRLRRPLGIARPLVRAKDYDGATIGIRRGGVARATFDALGARAEGYVPVDLSGFDGAELDPLTITLNSLDQWARALTANVVLWPKVQTVVMNRAAFDALSPDRRKILEAASREAVAPELARIAADQRLGLVTLCNGGLRLAYARPADLAVLRRAVQPVYARLEQDPLTKQWIESILRMRAENPTPPDTLRCP